MIQPSAEWFGPVPRIDDSSETWLIDALEGIEEIQRIFQTELPNGGGAAEVFSLCQPVLRRMAEFEAISLFRPDEDGLLFSFVAVDPPARRAFIEEDFAHQVAEGQFAWALYQQRGVIVPSVHDGRWTLMHTIATGDQVLGMLIAVLDEPMLPHADLGLKVLSVLMKSWASVIEQGALNRKLDRHARSLEAEVTRQTAEIRQREEEARRANSAKDEFLARISHEIRSPLGGILGTAGLLLEASLGPEERMRAETIYRSSELALEIVNEILDLARIESGHVEISYSDFDLRSLFDDVVSLLGPKATEKGVEFSLDWAWDAPRFVNGDPLRVRQVVLNLASNAIKFTDEGRVRIAVGTTDRGVVRIDVSDSGVGIAEDRLDSVFEKFEQAEASTAARFGGTGLGLPIGKELAEMMGGGITVSSSLGEGSTFTVTLPLPEVEPGQVDEAATGPAVSAAEVRFDGVSVLLADDDPVARGIAKVYLERLGCVVTDVENGKLALDAVIESPPAVVFMDGNMPVMDGLQSAEAIREHLGDDTPPIIALTAGGMERDRERSAAAGMVQHLTKPLEQDELCSALSAWVSTADADAVPDVEWTPANLEWETSELIALDNAVVEERFGADRELFQRLGQVFLESWPSSSIQLREAAAMEDAAALTRAAHRLRGAVATLGATRLADFVEGLETQWSSGRLDEVSWGIETIEEAVGLLEREFAAPAMGMVQ